MVWATAGAAAKGASSNVVAMAIVVISFMVFSSK